MAESTGGPPPDPYGALNKRIQDYFNSPKAQQHFYEGFQQRAGIAPTLNEFKARESRRYKLPSSQSSLYEGVPSSQALICREHGHNWAIQSQAQDGFVTYWECMRCGFMRTDVGRTGASPEPEEPPEPEPEEDDIDLMCVWCGRLCIDLDALDQHEIECEP